MTFLELRVTKNGVERVERIEPDDDRGRREMDKAAFVRVIDATVESVAVIKSERIAPARRSYR